MTMKDLLIKALDDAYATANESAPNTRKVSKSMSIIDVKPVDLPDFMKKHDIPDTASFDGRDNGYDGWDDILISWETEVPATDQFKKDYKKRVFNSHMAFRSVRRKLTKNGYNRVGTSSSVLKEFSDTTVFDMYLAKDFDRLASYYSAFFSKEDA